MPDTWIPPSRMVSSWILLTLMVAVQAQASRLWPRDGCSTQTVVSGDSCASLTSKCGISAQDFTKYNSDPNLCSALAPGQRVCCSAGNLPDIKPKPNSDASCATYAVKSGDTCSSIAAANGLKTDDLAKFNDKATWGWSGCDHLGEHSAICLSTGDPPMPQTVEGAVCGPLKPGTKRNGNKTLAELNPCPLNACCTSWGQCGTTPEFCTPSKVATGNPGAAEPGNNGCISNCGTDIEQSDAPKSFLSVGYYESWNYERSCLNMRADSIDASKYTHLHWGFAAVTDNFDVTFNDTFNQWSRFAGLDGTKKVISIGGWGFSTDPTTHQLLRNAMKPSNVGIFVSNILTFLSKNKLDGVDVDWEYPGAPDIPGIPAGLESDGPNYLSFLKQLRAKMPSEKTLSIAAPASFWYLKQFPIKEIADVVDYIVYMTYDLHGQWDYGNAFSQEGCESGNCLRSHVNLTETGYALAMITKAGVPSNKVVVGVSSYGRGFGMTDSGCDGPMCTYGGPDSTALPGQCTATAGYISNAEINMILLSNDTGTRTWYDYNSNSNILVYNKTQWVAFMDETTKASRTGFYKSLNFLGTVDWAIDLQQFQGDDDGNPEEDDDEDHLSTGSQVRIPCDAQYNTLEDLDSAAGSIPNTCKAVYSVTTLLNVLNTAITSYKDMMSNGYDDKFKTYAQSVSDSADKTVSNFMSNNGSSYFTCIVAESTFCCAKCSNQGGKNPCGYCFTDGACTESSIPVKRQLTHADNHTLAVRDHPLAQTYPVVKVVNESEPCPPDMSKRGAGPDNPYMQSVYWTLRSDVADHFYADILSDTGIGKDKLQFVDHDRGNACAPSAQPDDNCWANGYDYNYPQPSGYGIGDVSNPKDIVQKALDNSDTLQQQIADTLTMLSLSAYYGDAFELVDSISIPVLMIADAVDSMAQVETIADKIDEEKKKELILAFIGALLFFIPIAGQVLGSVAGLAEIASVLVLVTVAGDVALGVYSIVDDPSHPLMGILGIVLAPLALTDLSKISQAAGLRRGMSDVDVAKLGGKIGGRMKTLQKVIGACKKL